MYVDSQLEFSNAQALTSTAISTNVVDLRPTTSGQTLNLQQNDGAGEDVYLVVQTQTLITDSGSDATLAVTLESADDAGLTTNARVHASSGTLAFASYNTVGSKIMVLKLPQQIDYRRYLGLRFTIASGPFTAGAVDAFLTKDVQMVKSYAKGYSAS